MGVCDGTLLLLLKCFTHRVKRKSTGERFVLKCFKLYGLVHTHNQSVRHGMFLTAQALPTTIRFRRGLCTESKNWLHIFFWELLQIVENGGRSTVVFYNLQ